jgi:hypothetical protein
MTHSGLPESNDSESFDSNILQEFRIDVESIDAAYFEHRGMSLAERIPSWHERHKDQSLIISCLLATLMSLYVFHVPIPPGFQSEPLHEVGNQKLSADYSQGFSHGSKALH